MSATPWRDTHGLASAGRPDLLELERDADNHSVAINVGIAHARSASLAFNVASAARASASEIFFPASSLYESNSILIAQFRLFVV
jgi:hypothetical protein